MTPSPGSGHRQPRGWLYLAAALLVAALMLCASIGRAGLWDPYEVERAELARRIAVELFGARGLSVPGAQNSMPTLSDLGSGELGFTSMAGGMAAFGLRDWAGRLPLALWGVAGALVLFVFSWRMLSARAGLYGVLVLCSMPLYFVQARTMLGDIVAMACFAACFFGLSAALLERSTGATVAWLGVGLAGAAGGLLSRGVLLGVAAPAGAVGLGWLVLALSPPGRRLLRSRAGGSRWPQASVVVGLGALAIGVAAAWVGIHTLRHVLLEPASNRRVLSRLLGVAILNKPPVEATFDLPLRDLGHALFPWSALLPLSLGRLLGAPPSGAAPARDSELGVRVLLLVGTATAYGAHAALVPYTGSLPFVAPVLLAGAVAVALYDRERGATASPAIGAGTVVLVLVLLHDFAKEPVKLLAAFGMPERALPAAMVTSHTWLLALGAALFSGLMFFTWLEHDDGTGVRRWLRARYHTYRGVLGELHRAGQGNLSFGLLVVEAALVGLGAMLLVGRRLGWPSVLRLPELATLLGLNAWWVLPLALAVTPLLLDLGRLSVRLLVRALRLPPAGAAVLAALGAGGVLGLGFFPALASELSPKEAFASYAAWHAPGEPLGLLGVQARLARYYAGGEQVTALSSARWAEAWLRAEATSAGAAPRRWLVLRRQDLAEANALWRAAGQGNLPVLEAAGQILLASNQRGGRPDANPLAAYLPAAAPTDIQHPVAARFEDKLEALGWEVRDGRGRLVDHVVSARRYRMRFFYRVLKPVSRAYQAFLHIDGNSRRHNGDHDPLGGEYRMSHWRPGDIVVDPYELVLEPNFTPGRYAVFYGFFLGNQRFGVSFGPQHDDRVNGGWLLVR